MRSSGLPRSRAHQATPPRTERNSALDRIQGARSELTRKSLWMKRGSVAVVALAIGFGILQEWTALRLLAVPLAIVFWWLDASVTCADERLERLFDAVFQGAVEPPLMGDEANAAAQTRDPPNVMRRAMLSGPGVGLHWMMAGVAILFNILV